ncbi:MAG TPA: tail fiber domain-containing protein, partial [Cyclobacteriaceae bacterium]|nr:tail fiber domain-containing protein [Cyclobacteriaceae bacterium]
SVSGFFSVGQSSTFSGDVSVGGRLSVSDEFRAGASGSGIAGYLLRSNGSNAAPTWTPSIWDVTFGSVDNIYYSSSIGAARLGLGTSSPSTFLDIEHGNSLTPGLEINATATTNEESSIRMITADNTFTVGVNDVGTFVVRDGTNVNTSGSERLTITNTGVTRIVGNVGVGPAAPVPNVAMDVAGSIEYTGTITDVSDRRLKKNIEPLVNSLERILDVEGVSFEMKDENLGRGVELGVIAQELEIIFPELVFEDEKGFKSVNYIGLIAPMIEALKAQQKTIDSQQKTIAQLNESGKDLEQIVEKQQIEMDEMLVQINQIKQLLQMEAKSTAKK